MAPDISSLISTAVADRNFWGSFVDIASVVVIIGALFESVAEIGPLAKLFKLDQNETGRKKVESAGFWILIIGLVGELAFGIPVANDTTTIESKLSERVDVAATAVDVVRGEAETAKINAATAKGDADTALTNAGLAEGSAAEANKVAENAQDKIGPLSGRIRGARNELIVLNTQERDLSAVSESLEHSLLPRRFDIKPSDCAFEKYSNVRVIIEVVPEYEANVLASDIFDGLLRCGITPSVVRPSSGDLKYFPEGIFVSVGPSFPARNLGVTLGKMFDDADLSDKSAIIDADIGSLKPTGVPVSILYRPLGGPDEVMIQVGSRPNGALGLKLLAPRLHQSK
jgi:hypothetical protein